MKRKPKKEFKFNSFRRSAGMQICENAFFSGNRWRLVDIDGEIGYNMRIEGNPTPPTQVHVALGCGMSMVREAIPHKERLTALHGICLCLALGLCAVSP
jgi:hypothetical protein